MLLRNTGKNSRMLHKQKQYKYLLCRQIGKKPHIETYKHTGISQLTVSTATSKISLKRAQLLLYSDFVFKDLAKPKEWPGKKGEKNPLQPISLKFFYFSNALSNLPAELFSSSWCG